MGWSIVSRQLLTVVDNIHNCVHFFPVASVPRELLGKTVDTSVDARTTARAIQRLVNAPVPVDGSVLSVRIVVLPVSLE